MAGRGAPPNPDRARANEPERGEIQVATSEGWQYGETPPTPDGLTPASQNAWGIWMSAWFAAFWKPSDLPALRQLIRLYDQVEQGECQRAAELRLQMDPSGITPKGQQDRRWRPPVVPAGAARKSKTGKAYGHLKTVG